MFYFTKGVIIVVLHGLQSNQYLKHCTTECKKYSALTQNTCGYSTEFPPTIL